MAVRGYPEVQPIEVSAGAPVSLRLLAVRPGSGFPIVDVGTGAALGALNVRGAHTEDESEREEGP